MGTAGQKKPEVAEPIIRVGIIQEQEMIGFTLHSTYRLEGEPFPPGNYSVILKGKKILFQGKSYDKITFEPDRIHEDSFELKAVTIGIGFHWERKEDQRFLGGLSFIRGRGGITAVNNVALEDYLKSVISSEMSATSSGELLKAHAVISRSWLLAQLVKSRNIGEGYRTSSVTPTEIIRWYEREDHDRFDVCADDHCQRYQGITRQTTALVNEAIDSTRGEVITCNGIVCDARFSKCCGGATEAFENVWEPVPHPYLQGMADNGEGFPLPDLTCEKHAAAWIHSSPPAFCNTQESRILRQVLNDYDRETNDFYRWKVVYRQAELSRLIRERSGIDFGGIIALEPLERGVSGRIIRLRIVGTERVTTIGKELEIRRTLSPTHLYSAAFVVDAGEMDEKGVPQKFTLTGAGWGHGVGLCQIGAAVMAERGYGYAAILHHYFPHTRIDQKY